MKAQVTPHIIAAEEVKSFLLAGNATLTFQSSETSAHLTYKVTKADDKDLWFVTALTSPDNTAGYTILGTLYINNRNEVTYKHSAKSWAKPDALSVKVFTWVVARLDKPEVLAKMYIRHEGYCAKCGRTLTTPESIEQGYGPHCMKTIRTKINVADLKQEANEKYNGVGRAFNY